MKDNKKCPFESDLFENDTSDYTKEKNNIEYNYIINKDLYKLRKMEV